MRRVTAYDPVQAFDDLGVLYLGDSVDREIRISCPFHDDTHPSCRVRTDTGAWYCDPCAEGGAFPNLLAGLGITGPEYALALTRCTVGRVHLDDLPSGGSGTAAEEIDPGWQPLPGEPSPSPADARYPYHDEAGEHVATVHRLTQDGQKTFPAQHRRRDKYGNLRPNDFAWGHPNTWPLYHLPQVIAAVEVGDTVWLAEGEKDADALIEAGVVATTCAGGAARRGLWHKPHSTDLDPLSGAEVVIVADRDPVGLAFALDVRDQLEKRDARVRIVGSAAGKDAADHLHNGYGLDDFLHWAPTGDDERHATAPMGTTPSGAVAKRSGFVLISAASIRRQKRQWLIAGLLPLGAVTGCNGEEKAGKSIYAAHLAAMLSNGHLGDDGPQPSLIVAYEDDQPEWIARLQGAGADLDRVAFLLISDPEGDRDLVLPNDMEAFDQAIAATGARLVIIDPITDSVDMSLDAGKRQHVKLVARKLKAITDQHCIAILAINHWNRSQGSSARDRVADSIAWRQSFRSNIGFFIHPDKPTHRVVAQTGTNWAKGGEQYWFELKEVVLPHDPATGEPEMGVPVVIDLAPVPESARLDEHTLFARPKNAKEPTERDDAKKWLRQFLMDGPKKKSEIEQFAAFEGIKPRTLDRAADDLYVQKQREYDTETGKTISIWQLPAMPIGDSDEHDEDQ